MVGRKVTSVQQYSYGYEKRNASGVTSVPPLTSPPPEPSGGVSVFPDNATKIFPLPQNLLSLAFNAAKSQPHNPRVEQYLRRIYTKLVEERKNVRKALMEFLGFDDDIDFKVRVSATPSLLPKGFHTQSVFPREKPPPNRNSIAWVTPETPSFLRAPNGAALWRRVGG